MASKQNAIKTVGVMMIISLLGKILGLYRDVLFGSNFGTNTPESAAFTVAGSLPRNFLDIVFASVITASFIPIFNEVYESKGKEDAEKLSSSFITLILIASGAIVLPLIFFSSNIADIFCGGYDIPTKELTASLLRIMFPMIIFSGVAFCLTGILQCMGEFNIPAAMSVVSNAVIIIYYLFFVDKFGINGVAWVFLFGWATQVAIQIPFLIKRGFGFKFRFGFNNEYLKKIYRLMLPVMISTWAVPINYTVNTSLSTYAGEGGTAALYFSNSLFTIITGVFVLSVSNMVFPELSRLSLDEDKSHFSQSLNNTLRAITFFLIPMAAGLMILSNQIIRLVFERGLFNAESTLLTGTALIFFSLGIPGYGYQTILSRGFYALKDGKTPLYTAVLAIAINAAAGLLLLKPMGIGGLALASSVSVTAIGFIMLFFMSKRHGVKAEKGLAADIAKMLCAALAMSVCVYICKELLLYAFGTGFIATAASTAGGVLTGLLVYFVACKLLKIREADIAFKYLKLKHKGA